MKIKSIIAMLLVFGVFFNTTAVLAQRGTKTVKVDKERFALNVRLGFAGKVKGFQALLLKNGQIVAETAGGEARTKIDGQADMTVNTPSNIGSTAKFFAGTALLKLLSSPKGEINPTGRPLESWLDEEVYYNLPLIWRANIDASWKQVTFRQLLQHKSGVRELTAKDKEGFEANGYRQNSPFIYFLKPIKEADRNVRLYQNFNFTILTYLIPLIANPSLRETLDEEIKAKKLKVDDLYITQRLGNEFEKYMRANLFGKITPKINPSCDAPNEYPKQNKTYAMAYDSVSDTNTGFEYSERVTNGSCHAQGGWYVSVRELGAFVANFAATETLVSSDTKAIMIDDNDASNNLVWSTTYPPNTWIAKNFGADRMPAMDGLQEGSRSVLIKMPNNFYALAIVNSKDMQPWQLAKVLLDSFSNAASL